MSKPCDCFVGKEMWIDIPTCDSGRLNIACDRDYSVAGYHVVRFTEFRRNEFSVQVRLTELVD